MKKFRNLFFLTASFFSLSCVHNNGKTSINYKDTEHSYSMKADFPENETREVEEYMNRTIGTVSNMSFINTQ